MKRVFGRVAIAGIASFALALTITGSAVADSSSWALSLDPLAQVQPDGSWLTTASFSCDPGTPVTVSVTLQDPVTLQDAAPKIREILTQQKIDELLASWLETLRSQAQIHVLVPEFPVSQVAQP